MYTSEQEILLEKFANANDTLFRLGITSTDSFTGEIGEYIACKHFRLNKSKRVTKSVDGVCELGNNYQIKAKIVTKNNFNYNITNLDTASFHFLVIVYFDKEYNPIKILRIPSYKILDRKISITSAILNSGIEIINKSEINIPTVEQRAIHEFSSIYNSLETNGIIRSRRVVGDIGEFYACRRLNLIISENKNEKGIDARDKNGLTFEIKTRRVYQSDRRISENRRLNNLVGKSADYLIVVTIDRTFKCSGMWLIPMRNLVNPKSANLKIVNTTIGVQNLIPSKINWLSSGSSFSSFNERKIDQKEIIKNNKPPFKYSLVYVEDDYPKIEFENKSANHTKDNPLGLFILAIIVFYILSLILS